MGEWLGAIARKWGLTTLGEDSPVQIAREVAAMRLLFGDKIG